jgi:hypothetical protein
VMRRAGHDRHQTRCAHNHGQQSSHEWAPARHRAPSHVGIMMSVESSYGTVNPGAA